MGNRPMPDAPLTEPSAPHSDSSELGLTLAGAFVIANLFLVRPLLRTPPYLNHESACLLQQAPAVHDYLALLALLLGLGSLLAALALAARRLTPRLAPSLFVAAALLGAAEAGYALKLQLGTRTPWLIWSNWLLWFGLLPAVLLLIVLLAGACFAAAALARHWARVGRLLLTVLAPMPVLTIFVLAWTAITLHPEPWNNTPTAGSPPPAARPKRVVWILIDEWDYRLTFIDRPAWLHLPEFDSLRAHSFFAQNAVPPGSDTLHSVPGLTIGRPIEDSRMQAPDSVAYRFAGESNWQSWAQADHVFAAARRLGASTSVVGYYLPYCRLFSASLSACAWWSPSMMAFPPSEGFLPAAATQLSTLVETRRWGLLDRPILQREAVRIQIEMRRAAVAAAADPGFDFVLLHLPSVHEPYCYDHRTGSFTLKGNPKTGFLDSLEWADRTLADIRRAMQGRSLWDDTLIVLSADHPLRDAALIDGRSDARVPFLVVAPSSPAPVVEPRRFNTAITRDLILAALAGELASPAAVAPWLERHGAFTPAPGAH